MQRAHKNGLRRVKMYIFALKNKKLLSRLDCIQGEIIQRNLGVQTCHKPLVFMANHCLPKQNTISLNMVCGIENVKSSNISGHLVCFKLILRVLVIVWCYFCCHNPVCYDVQHQFQHKRNYASMWFDCFWIFLLKF